MPSRLYVRDRCDVGSSTLRDGDFSVDITKHANSKPSARAILILPPTGGETAIDRDMASKLCWAGFDVYVVQRWTNQDGEGNELGLHQQLYERSLKAINLVLKETPAGYVGMLGTSLGGTYTEVAVNQIDRIQAAFVIVGGAPLNEVIVHSDQEAMKKLHQERFDRFHFKDDAEYAAAIQKNFPLDSFNDPNRIRGKKLGMIIGTRDTTVPTKTQRQLQKYWKPQTVYEIDSSHFWTIVKSWWHHRADIVEFFSRSSGEKP